MFERFRGRRPSASMVISLVALFFALGGAGYAATQLPRNSVGTKQIRNNAVTYKKIRPGTIGAGRINQAMVQTRVRGTCSGTAGAIGQVFRSGRVSCNSTAPSEFGTNSASAPVTGASATVAGKPLPAGSFLILGAAYTSNTGGAAATLTCTLAVPGGSSQSRTVIVGPGARGALPINLASTVPARGATSTLACSQTGGTGVSVSGQINAIQTAKNS